MIYRFSLRTCSIVATCLFVGSGAFAEQKEPANGLFGFESSQATIAKHSKSQNLETAQNTDTTTKTKKKKKKKKKKKSRRGSYQ